MTMPNQTKTESAPAHSSKARAQAIDGAIRQVELLYEQLTGTGVPGGEEPYAPIPPEADATDHLVDQISKLISAIARPVDVKWPAWMPAVSIHARSDDELVVCFDVAGVARDSLQLTRVADTITVSGHRPTPPGRPLAAEPVYGPFRRSVRLPGAAASGRSRATLRDGILEIRVGLSAAAQDEHNIVIEP